MTLSKCCDAEVKFSMVDDRVGHGLHEERECSNCGELFPEVYDDEEEKEAEMRRVTATIHGRKDPGYPSVSFNVSFTDTDDLIKKIDKLIEEETDFRKVDVYLDDDTIFKADEIEKLESEYIYFS